MKIKCDVWKSFSQGENSGTFVTYELDVEPNDMVLDVLIQIYQRYDPSLSFRYSCGIARCGECAMLINGVPSMACDRIVESELRIEPLHRLPIIKDLVIDRRQVFDHIYEILPTSENIKNLPSCLYNIEEHTAREKIENSIRLTTCFECLICQSCCPRYTIYSDNFPGPLGLLMLAQMLENPSHKPISDQEIDKLTKPCLSCGLCVKYCPAIRKPLNLALSLLNCAPKRK